MIKHIKEQYLKKYFHQYIRKDYRPLNTASGNAVEPWAFIRVKNEMVTLEQCLNSILPVIKKGVIGYNNCTDGSAEFIEEFCKKHKGFIPFKYNYDIIPLCTEGYFNNPNPIHTFDYYCNKLIEKVPLNVWMIKIDADHIFDTERLKTFLKLPKNENEEIIVSNLNLHCIGNEVYVKKSSPLTAGDMFLTFRDDSFNFTMEKLINDEGFYTSENMERSPRKRIYTDLINYHFTYSKKHKAVEQENLLEFDKFIKNVLPTIWLGYLLYKPMLDKNRILSIFKKFNVLHQD